MSAGRCVGRVGGLAVLLGVGISLGQGIASADDTSAAGRSSSSSNSAHHAPGRTSAPNKAPVRTRAPAPAPRLKPLSVDATEVASGTTGRAQSARVRIAVAPAQAVAVSGPAAAAAAPAVHVTLRSVETDVLGWAGLSWVTPYAPLPNLPVPAPLDSLWLGARELVRRLGHPVGVAGSIDLGGVPSNTVVSADGTRAVVVTADDNWDSGVHTTQVAVMDPATGGQVGATLVLDGAAVNPPVLTADGTRAVITAVDYGSVDAARVTVMDLATGAQVGTTVALYGRPSYTPMLSADGSRVLITTNDGNTSGDAWLSAIDTATGAREGASIHLASPPAVLSADGSRAVIVTSKKDDATNTVTSGLAVFDTATGNQVGTTLSLNRPGELWTTGTQVMSVDDTHVLFVGWGPDGTQVAVVDPATGAQVGTTINLTDPNGVNSPAIFVDHGNAVIAATHTDPVSSHISTAVALVDTASGARVGATSAQLAGRLAAVLFNPTGAQALVVTDESNLLIPGAEPSHASVIDTATGAQVGSTIDLEGQPWTASGSLLRPVLSADGIHALIAVRDGVDDRTHVVVVDTTSGEQTGVVVTLPGRPGAAQPINADGSRTLITTLDGDDISGYTTHVSVVDTVTGEHIGTTVSVRGNGAYPQLVTADGFRAIVAADVYDQWTGLSSTELAIIDTSTGKQIGATRTLGGDIYGARLLGADGTRALIARRLWNPFTYTATTDVMLLNTQTGDVRGSLGIPGEVWQPWLSEDGTRAVFTNQIYYFWGLRPPSTTVSVLEIA